MFEYILNNWISIIAISISLGLLYRDYLQPFSLSVKAVGRVTLSKNPWDSGFQQGSIHLDLVISNQGARRGVVEDIALELQDRKTHGLFRSLAVVGDRSLNLGKELSPPALETFIGFQLGKAESTIKRVLFVPHASSASFGLQPTTYRGTIWVKHSRSEKWNKADTLTFTVDKNNLDELANSTRTRQPDGRYFVKWLVVDKPLDQTEDKITELVHRLLTPK